MIQVFSNNFLTTVSAPVAPADTTINLTDASGMNALAAGEYEELGLYNGTDFEVIQATARTGNALTVVRGSSPISCSIGDACYGSISADTINRLRTESMAIAVSDETTILTIGSNKSKFRLPYAMTLTGVRASVTEAPTGSSVIIDIRANGTTILSTLISIDDTQKTSTLSATPAVISTAEIPDDAEISVDITQVGATTTGRGLKVYLIGQQS